MDQVWILEEHQHYLATGEWLAIYYYVLFYDYPSKQINVATTLK